MPILGRKSFKTGAFWGFLKTFLKKLTYFQDIENIIAQKWNKTPL
jgi:hypothetical protein